jgi:hypothetical protein
VTQMDLLALLMVDTRKLEEEHFAFVVDKFFGPRSGRHIQLLDTRADPQRQRVLAALAADGQQGGAGGVRRYSSTRSGVSVHDYETGTDYDWTWRQLIAGALDGIDPEREQVIRSEHAAAQARAAKHQAEFERLATRWPDGSEVIWTSSWTHDDGTRESRPGWRCWYCDEVEHSDYLLVNNHGPLSPRALKTGHCTAQHYREIAARHGARQQVAGEVIAG